MVWTLFFKQQLSSSWPSTYLVGFHVYSNQPCYHSLTRNILKEITNHFIDQYHNLGETTEPRASSALASFLCIFISSATYVT